MGLMKSSGREGGQAPEPPPRGHPTPQPSAGPRRGRSQGCKSPQHRIPRPFQRPCWESTPLSLMGGAPVPTPPLPLRLLHIPTPSLGDMANESPWFLLQFCPLQGPSLVTVGSPPLLV